MIARTLTPDFADEVTSVLCAAFADYPVMRTVIGRRADFDRCLHLFIGYLVSARIGREGVLLGITGDNDEIASAALVNVPGERDYPPDVLEQREALWMELGAEARRRYEAFGAAAARYPFPEPHHHLNMIGVLPKYAGRGFSRPLLEHVWAMAEEDAASTGVSLTTERRENLALYEHFGYEVMGHERVSEELESWGLFLRKG